jgi:nucleoside phosphorylase/CheY-like chemotaxis protein
MKILIVDDAKAKVDDVRSLLAANGREIESAATGLSAREHLHKTQYDLLILDINLPFREGDEPDRRGGMNLLFEVTNSDMLIRPTHVVALTGFADLHKEFEAKFNNGQWTVETYDPGDVGWRERLKAKALYIEKSLAQAGRSFETDLCVITALATPELDAVRSLPWNWTEPEAIDSVTFLYRGHYSSEGKEFSVVAAAAPRMGMVASATLTQKLIQQTRPRLVAMTGICAGMPGTCDLGDVLFADPSWDWQMGKYFQDELQGAPDQIAPPQEITQRVVLIQGDRPFFIDLLEKYPGDKPNQIPRLHIGPVASGSAVLADQATIDIIKRQHRKAMGVDMELYGVYSAIRDCAGPKPRAFGLKSVCDFADHLKNDKYQKYASYMSARTLRKFAEQFTLQLTSHP